MSLEVSSIIFHESSLGDTDDVNCSLDIKNVSGYPIKGLFIEIHASEEDITGDGIAEDQTIKVYNVSSYPTELNVGQVINLTFKIRTENAMGGDQPITVKLEYKIEQESVRHIKVSQD